jgi:hypothetical protein
MKLRAIVRMSRDMSLAYDCVAALRDGDPRGRRLLDQLCGDPLHRLVQRLFTGVSPAPDSARLAQRALVWAALYLRSREPEEFRDVGVTEFQARVVLAAARMLTPPDAQPGPLRPPLWTRLLGLWTWLLGWVRSGGLTVRSAAFLVRRHSRPLEAVGGDWIGVARGEGEAIWVMVADVTGHGLGAYILAQALATLWEQPCVIAARSGAGGPAELLGLVGRKLAEALPDDLFVEATLGRFNPAGNLTVSAAGACPVVIREAASGRAECHEVGGYWLGMDQEDMPPRLPWSRALRSGDEVLMATDGLFDQPNDQAGPLKACLGQLLSRPARGHVCLHDAAVRAVREALRRQPQFDDIAIATVTYRGGGRATLT